MWGNNRKDRRGTLCVKQMGDRCGTREKQLVTVRDAANCGLDSSWQESSGSCDEAVTSWQETNGVSDVCNTFFGGKTGRCCGHSTIWQLLAVTGTTDYGVKQVESVTYATRFGGKTGRCDGRATIWQLLAVAGTTDYGVKQLELVTEVAFYSVNGTRMAQHTMARNKLNQRRIQHIVAGKTGSREVVTMWQLVTATDTTDYGEMQLVGTYAHVMEKKHSMDKECHFSD